MKYERIKYPDGQISVKRLIYGRGIIKERINSYEDLFFVKSLSTVFKGIQKSLFIPCLFGQRSDRRFEENQSFDLKIITDFINSCYFDNVTIFDPHSDVSLALIDNSVKASSLPYVMRALSDINNHHETTLVSPDAGAYKKVFEYGGKLGLPVVAANKFRDKNGEVELHFLGDVKGKECLIVDDICDGGRTFILLAQELRKQGASKVYLYISHGYFSNGFKDLQEALNGIYCTNSVKDIGDSYHDGINEHDLKGFITQYKII